MGEGCHLANTILGRSVHLRGMVQADGAVLGERCLVGHGESAGRPRAQAALPGLGVSARPAPEQALIPSLPLGSRQGFVSPKPSSRFSSLLDAWAAVSSRPTCVPLVPRGCVLWSNPGVSRCGRPGTPCRAEGSVWTAWTVNYPLSLARSAFVYEGVAQETGDIPQVPRSRASWTV